MLEFINEQTFVVADMEIFEIGWENEPDVVTIDP